MPAVSAGFRAFASGLEGRDTFLITAHRSLSFPGAGLFWAFHCYQWGGELLVEGEEVFHELPVGEERLLAVAAVHGAVELLVGLRQLSLFGFFHSHHSELGQ